MSADVDTLRVTLSRVVGALTSVQRSAEPFDLSPFIDAILESFAALDRLAAAEAQRDTLAEAIGLASDLLVGEGYDRDPDYAQEWETISAALAAVAPTEAPE